MKEPTRIEPERNRDRLRASVAGAGIAAVFGLGIVFAVIRTERSIAVQTRELHREIALRLVPPGTILPYGGTPDDAALRNQGWLPCDGRSYRTNEFRALFAAIGHGWGAGEVADEFRVPDLRGMFLRGVAGDAANDPDKTERSAIAPGGNTGNRVGTYQSDSVGRHAHPVSIAVTGDETGGQIRGGTYTRGGSTTETAAQGGNETRPKNAGVHYLIKF